MGNQHSVLPFSRSGGLSGQIVVPSRHPDGFPYLAQTKNFQLKAVAKTVPFISPLPSKMSAVMMVIHPWRCLESYICASRDDGRQPEVLWPLPWPRPPT